MSHVTSKSFSKIIQVLILGLILCLPALSFAASVPERSLMEGMQGSDVQQLQILLNQDVATQVATEGSGSKGQETTYFGKATKDAVKRFQIKYGEVVLAKAGVSAPTGVAGRYTRAQLAVVMSPSFAITPMATEVMQATAVTTGSSTVSDATCTLVATPSTITLGQTTTLSWTSTNAALPALTQGIGPVAASGSHTVQPTTTLNYALVLRDIERGPVKNRCRAKVTVTEVQTPVVTPVATTTNPLPTCTIAAPASVVSGQPFTLSWTSQNSVNPYIDHWNIRGVAANGSLLTIATTTTLYKMTVDNKKAGNPQGQCSVTVAVQAAIPTCSLKAEPAVTVPGGSVTLSWSSKGVDSNKLMTGYLNGVGPVAWIGSIRVVATTTTAYTMTVDNQAPGGPQGKCEVRVVTVPLASTTVVSSSGSTTVTNPSVNPKAEELVTHLYSCVLGRTPDTVSKTNWINKAKTVRLEDMFAGFFNAKELANKNLSNDQFVAKLYTCALSREADAAGKANWLSKLAQNPDRPALVVKFLATSEFQTKAKARWSGAVGVNTPVPVGSGVTASLSKFIVGQRVVATSNVNVRATASTAGILRGTQAVGSLGTVVNGGTVAYGFIWWNINYDSGVDGYSAESFLVAYTAPAPILTCTYLGQSYLYGQSALFYVRTGKDLDSKTKYCINGAWSDTGPGNYSGNGGTNDNAGSGYDGDNDGNTAGGGQETGIGTPASDNPGRDPGTTLGGEDMNFGF